MLVWYPATQNKLVVTRCWDCQDSQAAILSVTPRGTVDTRHGAWHAERHIRMNKCKGVRKQLWPWAAGGPGFPVPRALRCLTISRTLPTSLPAAPSARCRADTGEEASFPRAGAGFVNELSLSPDAKKAKSTPSRYRIM